MRDVHYRQRFTMCPSHLPSSPAKAHSEMRVGQRRAEIEAQFNGVACDTPIRDYGARRRAHAYRAVVWHTGHLLFNTQ
jgi:hypothetical protein